MDNDGQLLLDMLAPLEGDKVNEVDVTWQVTDVCRPPAFGEQGLRQGRAHGHVRRKTSSRS